MVEPKNFKATMNLFKEICPAKTKSLFTISAHDFNKYSYLPGFTASTVFYLSSKCYSFSNISYSLASGSMLVYAKLSSY